MGVDCAVFDTYPAIESAADEAFLTPDLAWCEFAIGIKAGEFGGGSGAAGGAVVGFAGAEDEVSGVGSRGDGWPVEFNMVDFGVALRVDGLADGPRVRGKGFQVGEFDAFRGSVDKEEPVAAPGDVAGDRAVGGDLDGDACCRAIGGDVVDGDFEVGVEFGFHDSNGGFNAVEAGLNPPHVGEGDGEADGPVAAHMEVTYIVEEDDADGAGGVSGFAEQGSDYRVRGAGFVADRGAVTVEPGAEEVQAFAQRSVAERGATGDDEAGGFAGGMGINDVNSVRHKYNIALSGNLYDAVVVGAGIVGAACARELMRAGLRVLVVEASGVIGGGATAAGMGHLAVMDDSEAQFALTSYSQRLWAELAPSLPADAEFLPCGSLWVAADAEEMAEVNRKDAFYGARGVPVEVLDERQLAEAEPALRPGLAGGLRMPADSVCYPPCAARYLLAGITVELGRCVTGFSDGGLEFADGTQMSAGLVVLATGTAVTRLLPWARVAPRKGHLLITDRYPGFLTHQLIELGYLKSAHAVASDSVAFNAQPRATGQILIGSSRQFGTEDPVIEQRMLSRMLARAVEYMPGLGGLQGIRTWTGFRAATPDKVPLIGRCPGYERVYVASGHEGLGISTSLATGRLIADEVTGRESEIPREWYAPGREFAHHD